MKISLDPSMRPVKVKARRYSAQQRTFLNKYIDKLVDMGFIIPNANADWQAAPLLVPKKGPAQFRMTIDLRPVNSATIKHAWPMPHLDSEVQDFAGSSCFASLDFCSGYWQLPIHPDSYTACGIVCPQGTYSSTRVLQGLKNATAFFQSSVEPLFAEMRAKMKAWLDDFNLYAINEAELLELLEQFFSICKAHNLYLSARKCVFFAKEIKWCGRIITSDGYKMDPSNISGLKDMSLPKNADELCEFIHCCRWMSLVIPNFNVLVSPLTATLEAAYKKSGRRTKRSIKNIQLRNLPWGTKQEQAFHNLQASLRNAVMLSYPKPEKIICVYTDASEKHWSSVVTQIEPEQLSLPVQEQRHEPLGFLGSSFKKAELNWSIYEKEGFAIYQTFDKLDYLFQDDQPVHVFTDHRNLLYVFAPMALEPTTKRHVACKVQRWAIFLSRFNYLIEHIDGSKNVFADILTRWARGYRSETLSTGHVSSLTLHTPPVMPAADEVEWPNIAGMREAQRAANPPPNANCADDGLVRVGTQIWVPPNAFELKLKLLVTSHCGSIGHRGQLATESILRENFIWDNMREDVVNFVRGCIHCLVSRTGETVPRPFGHALHAERPNEILHIDYLYLGPSIEDARYALLIKDDLSSYIWIWPTARATSEHAVDALTTWFACFGAPEWIVTDQGPHFQNNLLSAMAQEMRVKHHVTTTYSPWANGSIERVCREVLRSCRAVLHEFKLAPQEWPAVTECVQSIINAAPLKRLGLRSPDTPGVFRTPLEVFTSHRPIRPLLRALPFNEYGHLESLDEIRARQITNIGEMQKALEAVHREVQQRSDGSRDKSVAVHNARTNVQPLKLAIGDFVLVRAATKRGHKLQFAWNGPRRIVGAVSEWVYIVENLISKKRENVHARRLLLYRSNLDGTVVNESLLVQANFSKAVYETAKELRDIRVKNGEIQIQVEWDGLPDTIDLTWEPLLQVSKDLPGMLQDFLFTAGKRAIKRRALDVCNFT